MDISPKTPVNEKTLCDGCRTQLTSEQPIYLINGEVFCGQECAEACYEDDFNLSDYDGHDPSEF